jgi:FMN-dependent oxidoreductase (nitrilotriacetate monooxygenase family)
MSGTILNVGVLGVGMHPGAWRTEGGSTSANSPHFYAEIGRLAEKGKLHAIFLADTLAADEENFERPILGAMDPTLVLAALAAGTRHVGLVATASTSYNEPFNIARRFATLDHLSGGRGGWNVVTTFVPAVAANFGDEPLPEGAARYDRAEEFVDVVRALWRSWQPDALVADRGTGLYADRSRVQALDHRGTHFAVRGPLTLPRSPQGAPVLFQAGSSERGRALAARTADAVFTVQNVLAAAQAFRLDVRERARGFGRDPDHLKVVPGLVPILGGTEAEARARKDRLDHLSGNAELKKLALRVGVPVGELALDEPLPLELVEANAAFRGSEGFRAAAVKLAKEERLTVRELLYRNGGGHLQVVGTPEQAADTIELWTREGAADGFNVMVDVLPAGLASFVEEVVPLLQRRGTFRRDFAGETLRANLDLEVPA